MEIKTAVFIQSVGDYRKCPKPDLPEFAFIGRSNVGKSSLINCIAKNHKLAKISSKPGKTETINHFLINDTWFLVDLPGYGYSQKGKASREKWSKMTWDYISKRENLNCLFVLIDSRLEPQKIDIDFIYKVGCEGIPIAILFTKADKISQTKLKKNISLFFKQMSEYWDAYPEHIVTSAHSNLGRESILDYIQQIVETVNIR